MDSLQANFGESELDHTAVAGWVGVAVEIVFFLPPTAVRNDLVSSGGLGLIRSDSLRLALLAFDQEVSKLRLMEERERVLIENELRPYLVSEFVLDSAAATAGATHRLLADQRFQNLIWARKRRLEVTQRYAGNVAAVIDRVERLLGVELEDRMAS